MEIPNEQWSISDVEEMPQRVQQHRGDSPELFIVDQCTICLEDLEFPVTQLQCGHIFHHACIQEVMDRQESYINQIPCPLCRRHEPLLPVEQHVEEPRREETEEPMRYQTPVIYDISLHQTNWFEPRQVWQLNQDAPVIYHRFERDDTMNTFIQQLERRGVRAGNIGLLRKYIGQRQTVPDRYLHGIIRTTADRSMFIINLMDNHMAVEPLDFRRNGNVVHLLGESMINGNIFYWIAVD